MQENVNQIELKKSLDKLKQMTEKMNHNLNNVNTLIKENINSGIGVWDSNLAASYKMRWESLMEDFPTVIATINQQAANLENFMNNMNKVEER